MTYFVYCCLLSVVVLTLFFLIGKKSDQESLSSSVFECGFTSYYFSRFSFSIHYFTVGLVFLFLDLELCFLIPFFNSEFSDNHMIFLFWVFILTLVLGLMEEWKEGMLDWKNWV